MSIYRRSGSRGLQTFGTVISSEVLFEYELESPSFTLGGDKTYAPPSFKMGFLKVDECAKLCRRSQEGIPVIM